MAGCADHSALDAEKSKPWQPVHAHTKHEPLTPGEIYKFNLEIRPYGLLLKAGQMLHQDAPMDPQRLSKWSQIAAKMGQNR